MRPPRRTGGAPPMNRHAFGVAGRSGAARDGVKVNVYLAHPVFFRRPSKMWQLGDAAQQGRGLSVVQTEWRKSCVSWELED